MEQFIAITRTLFKHKYKLVILPLLVMALVMYLTKDLPKIYKTEAKLFINLQESKGLSLNGEDLKQYQVHSYFQNTIELFKSKKTIEKVQLKIVKLALQDNPILKKGNKILKENKVVIEHRIDSLISNSGSLESHLFPDNNILRYLSIQELSIDKLRSAISVFRILDSNFMKVEFTENQANRTQLIATLFIEALIEENTYLSKSKVKGHKDIIEKLVRQAKEDLDHKIKKLETYKVNNSIINLGEHTKAIVVYLVQLEGQRATLLSKIAAGSKGKIEVMDVVRNGNEVTLDLATHDEIIKLKKSLSEMNHKLLTTSFEKESNENFKTIEKNIEQIKDQVHFKLTELARKTPFDPSRIQLDLANKYIAYDLEAETASHMIPVINNEIERVSKYANRFAPHESTIGAFDQDINTAKDVYITLLNKLNLTEAIEYGSAESIIDVIDAPYLPSKPEPSKKMILIIAGGLAMLVLLVGVLIIMQLLDATITTVHGFEKYSPLSVIAALPYTKQISEDLLSSLNLINHQQLLKLANKINTSCAPGSVISIISTEKKEGKHYLALQLDKILNTSSKKVAFIDADWMSNHSTHFIDLKRYSTEKGILLQDQQLLTSINNIKSTYDIIIVITPPFNLSGENEFWLSITDHIVYLFKAGRNRTLSDKRTENTILNSPKHFLGTIINQVLLENMEDYLGEIPKRRSRLRILFKQFLIKSMKPKY